MKIDKPGHCNQNIRSDKSQSTSNSNSMRQMVQIPSRQSMQQFQQCLSDRPLTQGGLENKAEFNAAEKMHEKHGNTSQPEAINLGVLPKRASNGAHKMVKGMRAEQTTKEGMGPKTEKAPPGFEMSSAKLLKPQPYGENIDPKIKQETQSDKGGSDYAVDISAQILMAKFDFNPALSQGLIDGAIPTAQTPMPINNPPRIDQSEEIKALLNKYVNQLLVESKGDAKQVPGHIMLRMGEKLENMDVMISRNRYGDWQLRCTCPNQNTANWMQRMSKTLTKRFADKDLGTLSIEVDTV